MPIKIKIADEQTRLTLNKTKIRAAIRAALSQQDITDAEISVALVDDKTIHTINRQFLNHDYATDVISFPLSDPDDGYLEGEIVVSTDTAAQESARLALSDWTAEKESYLYIIHGTLHLAGYDDHTPADLRKMVEAEIVCLKKIGFSPPAGLR